MKKREVEAFVTAFVSQFKQLNKEYGYALSMLDLIDDAYKAVVDDGDTVNVLRRCVQTLVSERIPLGPGVSFLFTHIAHREPIPTIYSFFQFAQFLIEELSAVNL